MKKKYTLLSVLLILLALLLVILPKKDGKKEMEAKIQQEMVSNKSFYLTADQVTHRIIENDPTLLLIDLRPADQYKKFALPGSINLHPDSLLSKSTLELFKQSGKDKILLDETGSISEKSWLTCSGNGINRIYVLKGGMNEWTNTILKEQAPSATASTTDLDLISFRNAARQFFTGDGGTTSKTVTSKPVERVQMVRKPPAASSGGGC